MCNHGFSSASKYEPKKFHTYKSIVIVYESFGNGDPILIVANNYKNIYSLVDKTTTIKFIFDWSTDITHVGHDYYVIKYTTITKNHTSRYDSKSQFGIMLPLLTWCKHNTYSQPQHNTYTIIFNDWTQI